MTFESKLVYLKMDETWMIIVQQIINFSWIGFGMRVLSLESSQQFSLYQYTSIQHDSTPWFNDVFDLENSKLKSSGVYCLVCSLFKWLNTLVPIQNILVSSLA